MVDGKSLLCPLLLASTPGVQDPSWANCRKEECAWFIRAEGGGGESECAITKIATMSIRPK
jgi:hypothetical protein